MAGLIPDDPDTWLRRRETVAALNALGIPVTLGTLAIWAWQGKGPPFSKFGRVPIYRWGNTLNWVTSQIQDRRSDTTPETLS